MNPDPQNPGQPQPNPTPDTPPVQPQYPSPYPPQFGPAWQQPSAQGYQSDPTPQLPAPQFPGQSTEPQIPQTPPTHAAPQYTSRSSSTAAQDHAPAPPLAPVSTPAAQTGYDYSQLKTSRPRRPKVFIAIAAVVVLIALGVAASILVLQITKDDAKPASQSSQEQKQEVAALSSRQAVTFIPPANLSRYNANPDNSADAMAYNTEGNACSLQIGVLAEADLPGKDFADIVAKQVQGLTDQGVTVSGPKDAGTLTLKDASNPNKSYTMPTLTYTATDSAKQVRTYYSAAVLRDGTRAYVSRSCQVNGGTVDEAAVKPLNDDAATITVTAS